MDQSIRKEGSLVNTLLLALLTGTVFFAIVVIAYGMDSVIPGVHDAFHDFRHAIGIPCH
ncbi:MAG: CbtB-domain containing protein [Nitrospinae bacterium]|nr:CbtB-domain containing protein [Nitrospinota bacterium]